MKYGILGVLCKLDVEETYSGCSFQCKQYLGFHYRKDAYKINWLEEVLLIKIKLCSLPTYFLSLFSIACRCCKKVGKNSKGHYLKWFMKLLLFNHALQGKWLQCYGEENACGGGEVQHHLGGWCSDEARGPYSVDL